MEITISTITPVYNGATFLPQLVEALSEVRLQLSNDFQNITLMESIFVIDEAIDDSLKVLREIEKKHDWVYIIELSKNYGQHPATIAGILHTSGDWLITMDEDLQHHPRYILNLLYQVVLNRKDVCYGSPIRATHRSLLRDEGSILFKRMIGYLSGSPNVKYFNSFRCIRGSIARAASSVCGPDAYFDIVLSWFTQRVTVKEIELFDIRNNSSNIQSGYSILGLIKHGKRMIMSSKLKFLRIVLLAGIFFFIMSSTYAIYIMATYMLGIKVTSTQGWPSLITSIFFFGGITSL